MTHAKTTVSVIQFENADCSRQIKATFSYILLIGVFLFTKKTDWGGCSFFLKVRALAVSITALLSELDFVYKRYIL
jgi:hypothetical protein